MAIIELKSADFDAEVINYEGKVLIDFYAGWCGPCMMLSPIVEKVAESTEGVKFCKVNVDESPDIAMGYSVASIPTLILVENGEEKDRSIGLISEADLRNFIG